MKGPPCLQCGRLVRSTGADAIGFRIGARAGWVHVGCFPAAELAARELAPAAKPPGGKLVYTRRCPNCGKKVKRGTVAASQGYVWHAIPGRDAHLLWMPANLAGGVRA